MKKRLFCAALLCLMLTLCACNRPQPDTTPPQTDTTHARGPAEVFSITYDQWLTDAITESNRPAEGQVGQVITLRLVAIGNAQLTLYYNDQAMTCTSTVIGDYEYWDFQFAMPASAVSVTHVLDAEPAASGTLYLSTCEPWLAQLSASDILSVERRQQATEVGGLTHILRVTNQQAIAQFLTLCRSTTLVAAGVDEPVSDGGCGDVTIRFDLADGTSRTICLREGLYYDIENVGRYRTSSSLPLTGSSSFQQTFTIATEQAAVALCRRNGTAEDWGFYDGFADLVFVEYDGVSLSLGFSTYCFFGDFGTLYIQKDNICLHIDPAGQERSYYLTNNDFDEIIQQGGRSVTLSITESWLAGLTAADVAQLRTYDYYGGTAYYMPSILADIYTVQSQDVIDELLTALQGMALTWEEAKFGGLPYYTRHIVEVTLNDGTVHQIALSNGSYLSTPNYDYYYSIPKLTLDSISDALHRYGFTPALGSRSILLYEGGTDSCELTEVGMIDLSQLEFVKEDDIVVLSDPAYYISAGSGTIYIYSDTIFRLEGTSADDGFYRLTSGSFFAWIYAA